MPLFSKKKEEPIQQKTQQGEDEVFYRAKLSTVTFTADKLPILKQLLATYERQNKERFDRRQRRELFRPFGKELLYHLQEALSEPQPDKYYQEKESRIVDILAAYAGDIFASLEKLREAGWDGKNIYVDDNSYDNYYSDRYWRLNALITGLEAGNSQVTLEIPAEFAQNYETWLLSNIVAESEKLSK